MSLDKPFSYTSNASPAPYSPNSAPYSNSPYSPSSAPGAPDYNSYNPVVQSPVSPGGPPSPAMRPTPAIPDAVLNMAAKGPPEKKPWTYAPDMNQIREQREKVRRSSKKDTDITQSATYRMIHGLDSGDKPRGYGLAGPAGPQRPIREPSADDELRFSGLRKDDIPSKSFQRLQEMTDQGGSEIDTSSIYANLGGESDDVGHYDEQSIRYKGRSIPSKSFRMLQNLTGTAGDDMPVVPPAGRRPRPRALQTRPTPPPNAQQDPDSAVDVRYVGGSMPSKSFRMLQQSIGEPESAPPGAATPSTTMPPSDQVQPYEVPSSPVVNGNYGIPGTPTTPGTPDGNAPDGRAVAAERRRRRRRERPGHYGPEGVSTPPMTPPVMQPDSDAPGTPSTSSGPPPMQINIAPPKAMSEIPPTPARESRPIQNDDAFDEAAFLAGKLPMVRDPSEPPKVTDSDPLEKKDIDIKPTIIPQVPKVTEEDKAPQPEFDEEAYLSGTMKLLGDSSKTPVKRREKKKRDLKPSWARKWENRPLSQEFDESTYLQFVRQEEEKKKEEEPEWLTKLKRRPKSLELPRNIDFGLPPPETGIGQTGSDDNKPSLDLPFDEDAYLSGALSLLGGDPPKKPYGRRAPKPAPEPDASNENERPFDERSYLAGRIHIVSEGPKEAANFEPLPQRRRRPPKPRPTWAQPEEKPMTDDEFDEDAFLKGKVNILGGSVTASLPPRSSGPRRFRQKAVWERERNDEEDEAVSSDAEFDERAYLRGKVPILRQSVERDTDPEENVFKHIPSKSFLRLSRSVSREASRETSPSPHGRIPIRRARSDQQENEDDPNVAYSTLMYTGKSIPSQSFQKLTENIQSMKQNKTADPLDRLRGRNVEEEGIDVDKAMEKLDIEHSDPADYLDTLRRTLEESKIEMEDDVTDF